MTDTMLTTSIGSDLSIGGVVLDLVPTNDAERPAKYRDGIKKVVEAGGKLDILAAELLYEIRDKKYWKTYEYELKDKTKANYATFEEYVTAEVQFGVSKAYYLMKIYEKFVVELAIPPEILRTVEWSKAKEIVDVVTETNWKDLLKLLPDISVRELKDIVNSLSGKSSVKEVAPPAPKPAIETKVVEPAETSGPDSTVTRELHLFPAQAENFDEAMKVASFETGSDKAGNLIDMIATEFIASRAVADEDSGVDPRIMAICSRLDRQIQNIERAYGVKISVETVTTMDVSEA